MPERLAIAILLFVIMFAANWPALKRNAGKERAAYGFAALLAGYLALLFVTQKQWPNLDTLLHSIYAEPARAIVRMLKPS